MKAACDALLEQLKEGATLAPELDTHLRGCAACQAAQKAFDFSWGPESPPSEVALRQLRAASLTELQRSPFAHPWAQDAWTAVGISIAAAAGAFFALLSTATLTVMRLIAPGPDSLCCLVLPAANCSLTLVFK